MARTYRHPRPALTVDCVVFGLDEGDLKVLLIQRDQPPHAVRICMGAVPSRERMEAGLRIIAETLGQRPYPSRPLI